MAVPGKRLFWIAIIIVELVFVYVLWKPIRAHWRPSQRAAVTHPAVRTPEVRRPEIPEVRQPETRQSEVHRPEPHQPAARQPEASLSKPQPPRHPQHGAAPSSQIAMARKPSAPTASTARKPSAAITSSAVPERKRVVINAGLKTPEPIPPKPTVVVPPPAGPLDSFWCNISHVETKCDCKEKDRDQTANLVTR
jgi:hypothetical protein